MKQGKIIYKADIDGNLTVEQQITEAERDSPRGVEASREYKFEIALRYDITRTVCNILSNASIKYGGKTTPFCESLQKKLNEIFFALHKFGVCFLTIDERGAIIDINQVKGQVELYDPAYKISGFTQESAARKALDMYGVVTDAAYSVIDERGAMVVFSPQKDTEVRPSQSTKLYESFRSIFGIKKGQRKAMLTEIPMNVSSVTLPVGELKLLENKKDAVGTVARIYGIGEDMIQSGAILANKENAIIQTYADYKGLIYGWINQIESQQISFRSVENYEITFPGVPQMTLTQTNTTPNVTVLTPQ